MRFFVDYPTVKDDTFKDEYLVPQRDEFTYSFGKARTLSKPDANSGCWQIWIDQ